jgi:hypothetical protein
LGRIGVMQQLLRFTPAKLQRPAAALSPTPSGFSRIRDH